MADIESVDKPTYEDLEKQFADVKAALESTSKALGDTIEQQKLQAHILQGVVNQRDNYANESVMLAARLKMAGLA